MCATVIHSHLFPLGAFFAVFFLLTCAYFGNSLGAGIPLMTASMCFVLAVLAVVVSPNLLEIAPRYAGVTLSIANSFANISGIVAPLFAKAIAVEVSIRHVKLYTSSNTERECWVAAG